MRGSIIGFRKFKVADGRHLEFLKVIIIRSWIETWLGIKFISSNVKYKTENIKFKI